MAYTPTEKPGIMIYWKMFDSLDRLNDQDLRKMLKAMKDYAKDGVLPEFDSDLLNFAWPFIQEELDKDHRNYMRKKEAAREAGCKGAAARWRNNEAEQPIEEPDHYVFT